jgi:diguanylate cyclase (GGDEF)-like protein
MDLLSTVSSHVDTLDRPGSLSIAYGGTGYNMAVNLVHFGNQVTFGTVLADTNISRTIVAALQSVGVDARPDFREGLPEAGFSAHISPTGEMLSAVASTPVGMVSFRPDHVEGLVSGADAVVLECNLAVETIEMAVRAARAAGRPAWLAAVSEAKALKVLDVAAAGCAPDGLFINQKELGFLLRAAGFSRQSEFAAFLGGLVFETRGPGGVAVWSPTSPHPVADFPGEGAPEAAQSWLGAGDHFMAWALHRMCGGAASTPFDAADEIVPLSFVADASLLGPRRLPPGAAAVEASRRVSGWHHHLFDKHKKCNLGSTNPLEDRMRHLSNAALRDPLTRLANRRGLEDWLSQIGDDTKVALLLVDIDHFKRINDTWGHDVGDVVLSGMGGIMRDAVRTTDCACRWGGEEMIAVLVRSDETSGGEVAERLRAAVEGHAFACDAGPVAVTCSIGVSEGTVGTLDRVREAADRALYAAKRGGRNRVVRASALAAGEEAGE